MWLLSWRANRDRLDVALVAARLALRGVPVWRAALSRGGVEAGDYLVEASAALAEACRATPLDVTLREGPPPEGAARLRPPRVALLAGTASAFPYFAFQALALARLGVVGRALDGAAIAAGALDGANLLVLPGGFANWGLDLAEHASGADARVRAFLDAGRPALGTCGGASYLSAGRPGWLGVVNACPLYTHEYLQSGVAVVSLRLESPALGTGCPPTLELPYYHGPAYQVVGEAVQVAARFHAIAFPSRLGIDNPLDPGLFDRDLAGHAAILSADGPRGRAIVVSPHPEMGDLVRKYMVLDGYVRKYLPIRGREVMAATLAAYRPLESPSYRLVLNALHHLLDDPRTPDLPAWRGGAPERGRLAEGFAALDDALQVTLGAVAPALADDGLAGLVRDLAGDLAARASAVAAARQALERLDADDAEAGLLQGEALVLAEAARAHLADAAAGRRPVPQRLMEVELALALCDAWRRVAEVDGRLAAAGVARA